LDLLSSRPAGAKAACHLHCPPVCSPPLLTAIYSS
jgi:hypothetical protein